MKKKGLFSLIIIAGLIFMNSSAYAAATWYTNCSVQTAGTLSSGAVWLKLTDESTGNAFTAETFTCADTASSNAILATVLTAVSLGMNISIYADIAPSPNLVYHAVILNTN
jgi:hypothetical protein